MDTTIIESKKSQLSDVLTQMDALATRDDFQPEDVADLKKRADALKDQISVLTDTMAARAAAADMDSVLSRAQRAEETRKTESATFGDTPGEVFTRSRSFTNYDGHGKSAPVDLQIKQRAISLPIKTTDFPTAILAGSFYQGLPPLQTPLLDLIPTRLTSAHDFALWGTKIAEGGAAVVPEGDAKPALDLTEDTIKGSLDLVAVYTQATRQLLEDVYGMRDFIDQELVRAVLRKFEELAVTAVTSATLPTAQAPASGGTLQGAIRLGVAKVQTAGWTPNAVAVNPDDAANIDISMLGTAGACCSDGYWGLRVVPVPGLSAGSAIVGDFSNGAVTFQRQQGVSVFMTDSHAETFIHNVFTILAETRRKTVVRYVDAFAKVSVASS